MVLLARGVSEPARLPTWYRNPLVLLAGIAAALGGTGTGLGSSYLRIREGAAIRNRRRVPPLLVGVGA